VVGNNNLIVHQLLEEGATKHPVLVTALRRANVVIVSLRSRNGEALKVAERLQGGGHANAAAATLPKSVRNLPDAVSYLRQVLNPRPETPLNSLANLFDTLPPAGK
jgi:nanoRNase/pAp phosphatase (c-di-AMP/oligoRNAs hydrolase)